MAEEYMKNDEQHRGRIISRIFEKDVDQLRLRDEKLKWCQALVDADKKISGEISADTLQILDVQNVEIIDGKVREKEREIPKETDVIWEETDYVQLVSDHQEKIKSSMRDGKKTLVVNAYAGPGAGKTTASLATVAELKKMGYVAEYVSEYAKELVYENPALLDGSEKNQFILLTEQLRRMDRLIGKVDIIVTDSPILLNLIYGIDLSDEYKKMIPDLYKQYDNFNFFVKRGDEFEQNGRMQDLAESIKKDEEIKNLLHDQGLFYGTYTHETSEKLAQKIQVTYNRLYGEKAVSAEENKKTSPAAVRNAPKEPYQGIGYPKKDGQSKPDPVVIYGKNPASIITQMRMRNQQYEMDKRMPSCYIRSLNEGKNQYENPEKYDLDTGMNITTIYLKLPNLKREDFVKLTSDLRKKGAKYNPAKKAFYVTKQDDLNLFKDYLPQDILEQDKRQNEGVMNVSEEQILEMGKGAGLSVNDLQTMIKIGVARGLTNNDIEACLNAAIKNGSSKDQIYDQLVQGMNEKINAHTLSEPKRGSVLEALRENQKKIDAEKTEDHDSIHKDQEHENIK